MNASTLFSLKFRDCFKTYLDVCYVQACTKKTLYSNMSGLKFIKHLKTILQKFMILYYKLK